MFDFNFGMGWMRGGGEGILIAYYKYLMRMKRREHMIYKIILLYLIRCCVNFVLAQAVHSGAHVLCLDSRPVDISVALAVQTCVREQKS